MLNHHAFAADKGYTGADLGRANSAAAKMGCVSRWRAPFHLYAWRIATGHSASSWVAGGTAAGAGVKWQRRKELPSDIQTHAARPRSAACFLPMVHPTLLAPVAEFYLALFMFYH